ncbi:unnamed protein product [Allacma fusca]|uniref:Beta/gamma crystallin 'Greek key' domain-containing protein n=1 Tax=Allacma fusca TaxID=39272 RepID=A0A8J2KWM1_9HEXA|nr:unnamed protein product [Allacma fusca]
MASVPADAGVGFLRGVPDLTIYPFLDDIVRFCHNTRVQLYSNINYEGNTNGTLEDIVYFCHNTRIEFYSNINFEGNTNGGHTSSGCHSVNMTTYKSFRFFGNRDTKIDTVSLFPESGFRGEEILVDRSPFGGITQNIASVAYSGNSGWTVFEGINFSGKTACLPPGGTTNTNAYEELSSLNITTIGSLFKGCAANVTPEFRAHLKKIAFRK